VALLADPLTTVHAGLEQRLDEMCRRRRL